MTDSPVVCSEHVVCISIFLSIYLSIYWYLSHLTPFVAAIGIMISKERTSQVDLVLNSRSLRDLELVTELRAFPMNRN